MKKYTILLLLGIISFSKTNGIDLKLGANVNYSQFKEEAKYFHNPSINKYPQNSKPDVYFEHAITKEYSNDAKILSGGIYAKVLKNIEINSERGIDLKVGGGISFDIFKREKLNKGFKNTSEKINPSFPTLNQAEFDDDCKLIDGKSCLLYDNLKELVEENEKEKKEESEARHYEKDSIPGKKSMLELASEKTYSYMELFGSLELHKKLLEDLSIYGALDGGVSVLLKKEGFVGFKYGSKTYTQYFALTRNEKRVMPKVKTAIGLNYKYFDVELGVGYPNIVSFGFGTRIGF